ncbi:MAG: thymidylate synthase, partial [Promethearchaeota archaeon]
KLPPCHLMCIFNVQYDKDGSPYLNLEMLQRSCDVPVGVPFNIASYALFLELVSHLVGIPARYFAHTLVDAHIYNNQFGGVAEYLSRDLRPLPKLEITEKLNLQDLDELIHSGSTKEIKDIFVVKNYNPHPFIKFEVMV